MKIITFDINTGSYTKDHKQLFDVSRNINILSYIRIGNARLYPALAALFIKTYKKIITININSIFIIYTFFTLTSPAPMVDICRAIGEDIMENSLK